MIKQTIIQWVNQHTIQDDGWTSLHLACKPGHKDMFFYLHEKLGADLYIKNKNGISLMHKAACDDNSFLITYLRDKANFRINEVDNDGNTPLHFAALSGAEFASFWLMGFGQDVNALNHKKETPLHLHIKSELQMVNTKTCREMIFRGADRCIVNADGLKPIDLVDDYIQVDQIRKELKQLLGPQPRYYPCFQIKQPFRKLEKSYYTMKYYMGLIFSTFLMMLLFFMPYQGPH